MKDGSASPGIEVPPPGKLVVEICAIARPSMLRLRTTGATPGRFITASVASKSEAVLSGYNINMNGSQAEHGVYDGVLTGPQIWGGAGMSWLANGAFSRQR